MMIGVDHSSTGGSVEALSHEFGSEDLSLIILDSHFDAILPRIRCELAQYDLETNNQTRFRRFDPFLFGRPESYNADSFIYYLVDSGLILPENLIVLGVSDHPPAKAFEISDERVKNFIDSYLAFEKKGSKIVPKHAVNSKGVEKSIVPILNDLQTRYVYISVDIDIGANSAHTGSRYLNVHGITETQIYLIAVVLRKILAKKGIAIAGFDIMETDVHRAGKRLAGSPADKTYQIEAEFTSRLFPALQNDNETH
jgi:arginase family enzyme